MIPPFEINIGHHRYYRVAMARSVTKAMALHKARDLRKEGHLARIVKDSFGNGWTTYFAANPKHVEAFKRTLPREIQYLV